jgi:CRISP-associated protein Cas1
MSEHRVILIESPSSLKIDTGRLRIDRKEQLPAFIRPDDIDVLCLHHPVISISNAVLQSLTEAGAIILITDRQHQPCAVLYPLKSHARQSYRLRRQIDMEAASLNAELWQQIIRSRIKSEAANLKILNLKGSLYLDRMVPKVALMDTKKHESQAAQHYWKYLFSNGFNRIKKGADDGINSRLNFGYAILRAIISRQLAIMGVNLSLGIGHRSSENPFNLADDFIEPYRFIVERQVAILATANVLGPLDSNEKKELLTFITTTITMEAGQYRLNSAIESTIDSYCRILDGRTNELVLPVH